MYDRSYESTSRPHDHFCSPWNLQDTISAFTFNDVPFSATLAASQIGEGGSRIGPFALDLNEVGNNYHAHFEKPSRGSCHHQAGGEGRMGEITLEELLLKNYDVSGPNPQVQQFNPFGFMIDHDPMSSQGDWMQQQMMGTKLAECCSGNRVDGSFEVGFEGRRQLNRFGPSSPGISILSPCESGIVTDRKRRCTDEAFDKTWERRKKRMMKNRESAAKSRARKQDYMNQLEAEVKHLRKANELLMKEKARLENQNPIMKVETDNKDAQYQNPFMKVEMDNKEARNQNPFMKFEMDNKEARVLVNGAGGSYDDRVKTEAELAG